MMSSGRPADERGVDLVIDVANLYGLGHTKKVHAYSHVVIQTRCAVGGEVGPSAAFGGRAGAVPSETDH